MAGFSAGTVSATLEGNFSPAGFAAFNSAMQQAEQAMKKAESTINASATKATHATDQMGHASLRAAGLHQDAAGRWRTASGQIASSSQQAAAGVANAAGSVEHSSGLMDKAMHKVGQAAKGAAVGGILALGTAIYKSVTLAADFEHQLSLLGSASGANAKQMKLLKQSALDAGAATKYSALEAAQAQTALAKGGLLTRDILKGGLTGALSLAAAGEIDLAQAAETTVNALNNFQLGAGKATHVADALSKAANVTTTDVGPLATALTEAGGSAHAAGVTFDSTVTALEALAKTGVQGSLAGGSLKSAINAILTPSKKQTAVAKESGIAVNAQGQAFITAGGKLKSFSAISEELHTHLGHMTQAQRTATEAVIAGSYGQSTLQALYAAGPKTLKAYEKGLNDNGYATKVAAKNQDNLSGAVENLKGSLETAGIILGEGLLPGLTEGAKKLTEVINHMGETGQLDRMAKGLASGVTAIIEAGPQIADSMKIAGQGVHVLFDLFRTGGAGLVSGLVAPIELVLRSIRAAADVANKLDPFGDVVDTGGLSKVIDKLSSFRESAKSAAGDVSRDVQGISRSIDNFGGSGKSVSFKIKGDPSDAVAALKRVQAAGLSDKVMKILGKDESAAKKVKEIRALNIGPKTARILGENADAIAKLGGVQAAISAIPRSVTVQVGANVGGVIGALANVRSAANATGAAVGSALGKRKGHATGRAPGDYERALVGEGHGPELVGNPDGGWTWVTQPTLMDLAPGDAVIPSDPQYSGRALGLMFGMLGIPGYAKGKPAKKKPAAKAKVLPIPDAVTFGAVPEDELNNEKDTARDSYQKRRDRVHKLDVDIRDDHKKVAAAKKGKAKKAAQAKLAQDQRDRHHYNDGGDGLASLADMRKRWQELSAQAKVLHTTNLEIERLDTRQQTDRTKMETAAKRGDEPSWLAAKKERGGILATLRDKYAKALKLAKPDSNFAAELEGKLAGIEGDIADAAGDSFADQADPVSPFDNGMTAAERAQLDQLQAAQSLASLTADLGDDQATASATEQFLSGLLGAAMSDPARGGASVIGDLADQVKTARDNVASFAAGTGTAVNQSQDLQAQINQANLRADVAEKAARVNADALSVFQGAGDIGSGFTQNIYTLHPGDPRTLAAVAGAAVGGMSQQSFVTSPRTNLGL